MSEPPSISVVVPVHNQAGILELTLPAVTGLRGATEIVFVDDGSSDNSARIITRLIEDVPQARLVRHERNHGRAAARNTGNQATKGEVILFLDADIIPEPDILERLAPRFLEENVVGVLCRDEPDALDDRDAFHRYLLQITGPRNTPRDAALHFKYFISGHSAVTRAALEALGGFAPEISYGEDLEFAYRITQRFPRSLRFEPDAVVHQRNIGDLAERIERLREFGYNLPLLKERHPGLLAAADIGFVDSRLLSILGSRMLARIARFILPRTPWPAQRRLLRLVLASAVMQGYRGAS